MQTAKCFLGHLPSEYMKWPNRFLYYPTQFCFSFDVFHQLVCCCYCSLFASLICCTQDKSSCISIFKQHFVTSCGTVLQEYRHNCIHCFVYYTGFSYSVCLRGKKVILLGSTSCPSAEPVNWILHAATFLFAAALCYLSEKDAEREQGPLCITVAQNVI